MKNTITLVGLLTLVGACHSPDPNVTRRDDSGNFVTTSDYQAMERGEFMQAMQAGLNDFDARMEDLRARANKLGGDSLEEFAECSDDLQEKRQEFVNEMKRTEAALADNWPDRREDTLECYYELRSDLDKAYEEVLES